MCRVWMICSGATTFILYTANIGEVIRSHGLEHHSHADDNDFYASCSSLEVPFLRDKILKCIDSIKKWMASNHLILNSTVWVHLVHLTAACLPDCQIRYHIKGWRSGSYSRFEEPRLVLWWISAHKRSWQSSCQVEFISTSLNKVNPSITSNVCIDTTCQLFCYNELIIVTAF